MVAVLIEYGSITTFHGNNGSIHADNGQEFIFFANRRTNIVLSQGQPLFMGTVNQEHSRKPKIGDRVVFEKTNHGPGKRTKIKPTVRFWAFAADYNEALDKK